MTKRACKNCEYFSNEYVPEIQTGIPMGECRYESPKGRFPRSAKLTPTMEIGKDGRPVQGWYIKFYTFPSTSVTPDYWCGDFEERINDE